ncbi:HlyD family secretion protein [Pseudoduganella chitinolytica]|uniref:HlyD family efflux transporter periplasmic adaptor subunit n=1 Tax=Pseudoduganella chitinolytica TaxID=34070 RepID=A0ABY8BHI9_9BURK|nr:HlyD family efflux transporter periplasmic adaptor subunit [Pseudoduganella chitinolytica]WEF35360.1 HlyD family efflux transporter periplasmic adaptor subunit [Pseudoduganella chitinolytica]
MLARPVSFLLLTCLFVAIATAVIIFFTWFSVARKAQVPGVLVPVQGLIRIIPPHGGVVTEMMAREGSVVEKGEVLVVLSNERASEGVKSAEQRISALLKARRTSFRNEQQQSRRQSSQHGADLRRRMADSESEIRRISDQVALQERRIALVDAAVRRYENLYVSRYMPALQVQEKQAELIDQQQRLADLLRARAAVERTLADTRYEASSLEIQVQRDQEASDRDIAALEQELTESEARRTILVRAPRRGVVTAITAEPGQATVAGQAIAAILPNGGELEAELYVTSRSIGFVRPGMPVLLRYQAYSYQKFGHAKGTVREVSATAMRAAELNAPGAAMVTLSDAEPVYRVRVRLDNQAVKAYGIPHPLKSGALLDASILLEHRRLYEWILDPLYTVIGRL